MKDKLPQGWAWVTVEETCEVILGQSPPGSSYNEDKLGMPFFQGKADFGEKYPTVRKWTTAPKKIGPAGSILVSIRAPVGPTNLAPMDCAIGRGLAALVPFEGISTNYLLWAIRNFEGRLVQQASGSTFEAITGQQLKQYKLPLAPSDEQKLIANVIEEYYLRLNLVEKHIDTVKYKIELARRSILANAYCGELMISQDCDEEPASTLLERITDLQQ